MSSAPSRSAASEPGQTRTRSRPPARARTGPGPWYRRARIDVSFLDDIAVSDADRLNDAPVEMLDLLALGGDCDLAGRDHRARNRHRCRPGGNSAERGDDCDRPSRIDDRHGVGRGRLLRRELPRPGLGSSFEPLVHRALRRVDEQSASGALGTEYAFLARARRHLGHDRFGSPKRVTRPWLRTKSLSAAPRRSGLCVMTITVRLCCFRIESALTNAASPAHPDLHWARRE